MEPAEDAVGVLRHAWRLCRPEGIVLDLTTVPPAATVEADGTVLGRLDQVAFLERAATTERAVDLLVAEGALVEEAVLDLDVRKHFDSAGDLIADVDARPVTELPDPLRERVVAVTGALVERSFCRLRRLRRSGLAEPRLL